MDRIINEQRSVNGDEAIQLLAAAIIKGAVEDWRRLIKRRAWEKETSGIGKVTFDEIRNFFNSGWCGFLMNGMTIKPETILIKLEEELKEAKKGVT